MDISNLLINVEKYVANLLDQNLAGDFPFHNLQHTYNVIAATKEIAGYTDISEKEIQILITAAWFHDCGYTITYMGHEEESKILAGNFLSGLGCDKAFIQSVKDCIAATKFPQKPITLIEKILCDADLYHFTQPNYPAYEQALRKEFETHLDKHYTDIQWKKINSELLHEHYYHTHYGKTILTKFKNVNLQLLGLNNGQISSLQ